MGRTMHWRVRRLTWVLGCMAATTMLFACGGGSDGEPASTSRNGWPTAALPAEAAVKVDDTQFLSIDQLRKWQKDLDQRGLRATGSSAHEQYIDALYQRLTQAGVKQLYFESATLKRWSADQWALEIVSGTQASAVATASYIPYSGTTPADGITAEMTYLAPGAVPDGSLAGKIVLVDVPKVPLKGSFFTGPALRTYDPAKSLTATDPYERPYVSISPLTTIMERLQASGAAGVVAILDEAPQTAAGMYIPYDRILRRVPGVFVDREEGARLKGLAASRLSLKLSLPAKVEQVQTRNLIGIIPGAADDLVVINSHTDGTNGLEDNGPNAIVDIAQYLTRLRKDSLPRSVMVLLTSGHFAGGVGAEDFLARHAHDGLLERIASVVTIEHLGAREWLPDAQGILAPTGKFEPVGMFMPTVPALVDAAEAMLKRADASPGFVLPPTNPKAAGTATEAVWPGEGQYFYSLGRLPTINYITGPYYLLNIGVSTADKVDYDRIHRETAAFTQLLLDLSRVSFADLRAEIAIAP